MNEPLRIAWLGHQSGRAGDGLLTYSREIVAGLRGRGVKVFFVHHGALAAVTDDTLTLRSLTGSHRYIISSPRTKRIIRDLLGREPVDLVNVSLSCSTLLDFGRPELCHELGLPVVATFHVPYDSRFSLWQGISAAVYRLYAQSLASFDRVIIFSEQQKSLLENYGVPAVNVAVIPNGVDVDKYTPGSSAFKQTSQASPLVGQLRLALRTLIEFPDFRAELGRRARARVVERYGLSDNLDRLLAVYRELRPAAGAAAS